MTTINNNKPTKAQSELLGLQNKCGGLVAVHFLSMWHALQEDCKVEGEWGESAQYLLGLLRGFKKDYLSDIEAFPCTYTAHNKYPFVSYSFEIEDRYLDNFKALQEDFKTLIQEGGIEDIKAFYDLYCAIDGVYHDAACHVSCISVQMLGFFSDCVSDDIKDEIDRQYSREWGYEEVSEEEEHEVKLKDAGQKTIFE